MENLEALAAHCHVIERLIPLLDAIRAVAEIAWRRAEQGYQPLMRYSMALGTILERTVSSLDREERARPCRAAGQMGTRWVCSW
jgi:hypothetical protein